MYRTDLSSLLFHWTSGDSEQEALNSLYSIILERKIRGSNKKIKGLYNCVCFTETPVTHFDFNGGRYWPFGISVSKKHVFSEGGRPVIYQPEYEFALLPEELRWRHMRYEPDSEPPIDFTWEREWRIHETEFILTPQETNIIVLNKESANTLEIQFEIDEWSRYSWECVGYGETLAEYPQPLIYSIKIIPT